MTSLGAAATGAGVPASVVARIEAQRDAARANLAATVARRERAYAELITSKDPVDQAIARMHRDFLLQVEEVERSEAAMLLAADTDGDTVVGRVGVFDDERDLLIVPWHAPEGQRYLTARDRLLITERGDQPLAVHRLTAEPEALAERIRHGMRTAARREQMSDPLSTLTTEQSAALEAIAASDGDVLLTGPPGSGKSAIVLVELARRVLSHPDPHTLRVLFVTGTPRLAQRVEVLGRLLGVASITPTPQDRLPQVLGLGARPAPVAGQHPGADGADVPRAIEAAFDAARQQLHAASPVPHPLGRIPADEIAAVRTWRAREPSTPYRSVAQGLRDALIAEYERIVPRAVARSSAEAAATELRPHLTPTALVGRALPRRHLPAVLRDAARGYARSLLNTPPRQSPARWDLVVVDEYQRLPGVLLALLRREAGELLLSGDPHQAFTDEDVQGTSPTTAVTLTTSLRLPATIGTWIDDTWRGHGLSTPSIVSAAEGGTVRTLDGASGGGTDRIRSRAADGPTVDGVAAEPPPPEAQVIAPASLVDRGDGWLSPLDALGLEWSEVVLVDPERILAEHGPPGLFVAATRAIDTLTVDPARGTAGPPARSRP